MKNSYDDPQKFLADFLAECENPMANTGDIFAKGKEYGFAKSDLKGARLAMKDIISHSSQSGRQFWGIESRLGMY